MYFSLDLPVTENQIPNTKYQLAFFVAITIWNKKTAWPLPFSKYYGKKQRLQPTFGIYWFLVTGLANEKNISKHATKYLTKMLTLYLDRIQTENVFYALVRRIKCVWVAYKWSRPYTRPTIQQYSALHC